MKFVFMMALGVAIVAAIPASAVPPTQKGLMADSAVQLVKDKKKKKPKYYKAPEKKSGCVFGSRNKRGGIQLCRGR